MLKKKSLAPAKIVIDWHTENLTPEKEVKNLLDHGTVFNMSDDQSFVDDLLNADLDALEVGEDDAEPSSDDTFEDEN